MDDEINLAHVVVRVNYALEILKLFSYKGKGEGIPVDISVLPDFVIDFNKNTLDRKRANDHGNEKKLREKPINELGGRACRITRNLAYLRYQNDGTFRINLFCKTDEIGCAFLSKYLGKDMKHIGYHPIDLSGVHLGPLSRATLLNNGDMISSPAYEEHELSAKDLEMSGLDKIKNSTIIMLTSIRMPDFKGICSKILDDITIEEPKLIIDTSRTREVSDWQRLFNLVRSDEHKGKIAAIFFENNEDISEIFSAYASYNEATSKEFKPHAIAKKLHKYLDTPIIFLESSYVLWIDKQCSYAVPLPKGVDIKRPNFAETFKAGFLLAFTVGRALEKWRRNQKMLIRDFEIANEPEATKEQEATSGSSEDILSSYKISIKDAIVYGCLLCGALAKNEEEDKYPDRDDLIKFASEIKDLDKDALPKGINSINIATATNYWSFNKEEISKVKLNDLKSICDGLCFVESLKSKIIPEETKKDLYENIKFTRRPSCYSNHSEELDKYNYSILTSIAITNLFRHINNKRGKNNIGSTFEWAKTRKRGETPESKRIVLMDLDSTLMDSTDIRRFALTKALKEIIPLVLQFNENDNTNVGNGGKLISACVEFYEIMVYHRWPLYLHEKLNLGDFRQMWNLGSSYAVFLVLISFMYENINDLNFIRAYTNANGNAGYLEIFSAISKTLINPPKISIDKKNLEGIWELIDNISPKSDEDEIEEKINKKGDEIKYFLEKIGEVQSRFTREIALARQRFTEVHFEPYKEAIDFIHTLEDVGGTRTYIATEGHQETQLLKIRQSGLGNVILEEKVLSTDLVSTPEIDLLDLEVLRNANKQELNDINLRKMEIEAKIRAIKEIKRPVVDTPSNKDIEVVKLLRLSIKELEENLKEIKNKEKELKYDCEMIEKFGDLFKKFSEKKLKAFFALLTYAIADSDYPQKFLRAFSNVEATGTGKVGKEASLKIAMIGDRPDNDIIPLLDLFNKNGDNKSVITIRIMTKKYCDEPFSNDKNKNPMYVVDTLEEAKYLLLDNDVWRGVNCICYPRILDNPIGIDDKGDDKFKMLIWAQNRPNFTSALARQIIEENCFTNLDNIFSVLDKHLGKLMEMIQSIKEENKNWDIKKFEGILKITIEIAKNIQRIPDIDETKKDKLLKSLKNLCYELFISRQKIRGLDTNEKNQRLEIIDDLQSYLVQAIGALKSHDTIQSYYYKRVNQPWDFGEKTTTQLSQERQKIEQSPKYAFPNNK